MANFPKILYIIGIQSWQDLEGSPQCTFSAGPFPVSQRLQPNRWETKKKVTRWSFCSGRYDPFQSVTGRRGRIRGWPAGVPKESGTNRRRSDPKRHHRTWTTWLALLKLINLCIMQFTLIFFNIFLYSPVDLIEYFTFNGVHFFRETVFRVDNFELRALGERLAFTSFSNWSCRAGTEQMSDVDLAAPC